MAPLVDIAGLRYSYPGADGAALDGVNLALDGGLCVVAGPSGGGKSTLLRLLNGLVPHMHGGRVGGRALVAGRDVLLTPTRRLAESVGFVFQDAERQAVHTTVERDIAFGLENLATPPAQMRRRVEDVMDRLGIGGLRDRAIAGLSGGERQRVAVAGALVLRPRLLVLDEPFAQLDAAGAAALLELCLELRDGGTAVALSEHRLDAVLPEADAVVHIAGGRLLGPARAVELAPRLDSAPQVVRLSRALRWSPSMLDAQSVRSRLPAAPPAAWSGGHGAAHDGEPSWTLGGVTAGPGAVLRDVDLAGWPGEVLAVMGRNGAGKSTLLRVIAGLAGPTAGRVERRPGRVAYLPQNPSSLLHRESVAAEVAWTLRAAGAGRGGGDAGLATLLRTLGVDAIAGRDPRDLSSGQRQRAAIAAILCGSPSVALLDEPTRGMDERARAGLVTAVRALASRGASVVVATHDSDLAACVADRVIVVRDGGLDDRGPPCWALSGDHEHATQLGRLFEPPAPVTVEGVAAWMTRMLPAVAP